MARLFNSKSKRLINQITDTIVYVLRKFFSYDDNYAYDDDLAKTNIYIDSEYAMKEYQDEGAPLIIVGNISYSANLNTTLGDNFYEQYRMPSEDEHVGPIIGTRHIVPIPFSCQATFLGQNDTEIEMIADLLVNYFLVILKKSLATFGIEITNIRFGRPVLRTNYPKRDFVCALDLTGVVNAWQVLVTENHQHLFEEFILEIEKAVTDITY